MDYHVCIIGAIREEIAGIKGRMRIRETVRFNGAAVFAGDWQGLRTVLVRSGVGGKRAAEALRRTADRFPLSQVLSIGFAGGLDPALQVGDLLIADSVTKVSNPFKVSAEDAPSRVIPAALVNQAMVIPCPEGVTVCQGGLLTVDDVITQPADKKRLGGTHHALGVDMETYDLLEEAEKRGIPFLSVRAVTDAVDQELMNCSHLVNDDGSVSTLKAGWHVLTHPGDLTGMIALGRHAKLATGHLTAFLAEYFSALK